MALFESGEMYLETIYILSQKKPVRSVDVAEHLNYSRPSVSRAVGILKKDGYLTVDPATNYLVLTESGKAVATRLYERHEILKRAFTLLGVDEKVAAADACKIEHIISDTTFAALKSHFAKNKYQVP